MTNQELGTTCWPASRVPVQAEAVHPGIYHRNGAGRLRSRRAGDPGSGCWVLGVPAAAEPEGDAITAPMVGTFYAASAPEQPPFVSVGDRVRKGQPVCLLEAMKMMSEIPAPCDCEITAVLKENGALVSFGEPLFRYQPC